MRAVLWLSLLLLALPGSAAAGPFEDDVLAELNYARAQPREYARELREAAGGHGGLASVDYADGRAIDEAVDFLMDQQPLPPLRHDEGLAAAAAALVGAQSGRRDEGHGRGAQSLGARLQAHGVWAGLSAEAVAYGYATPRDVVAQLVIDSGVPGRGHRKDIFRRAYQAAGVACGRHAVHGVMCVIDYAGAFAAR